MRFLLLVGGGSRPAGRGRQLCPRDWWWKILPYPSMHDQVLPHAPPFVQAMLNTGFMFEFVRIIEVAAGACLRANFWVPVVLVVVFPLSLGIWTVDAFSIGSLHANVMGWAVLTLNAFLLVAYFGCYVPHDRNKSRIGSCRFGAISPLIYRRARWRF